MMDNTLPYELPINYVDNPRYLPSEEQRAFLEDIPDCIAEAVIDALPVSIPINPFNVFYYVKRGLIPIWVLKWFIRGQGRSRSSAMTRFYRALHLIEIFREGVYFGHGNDPLAVNIPPPAPLLPPLPLPPALAAAAAAPQPDPEVIIIIDDDDGKEKKKEEKKKKKDKNN